MATKSAIVTHAHPNGINGSILQAFAIQTALNLNPNSTLDVDIFIKTLQDKIRNVERNDDG